MGGARLERATSGLQGASIAIAPGHVQRTALILAPMRRLVGLGLALCALGALSPTTLAREPRLAVGPSKLRSSLFCQESVTNAARTPVLLVTGTGVDGSEAWPDGLQLTLIR